MLYRTQENCIDGLVITFYDTSDRKKLEAEVQPIKARLAALSGASKPKGNGDGIS